MRIEQPLRETGLYNVNVSFEAFTEVMFQVDVFWVVTPCGVVVE
jgi:hypothetical protein